MNCVVTHFNAKRLRAMYIIFSFCFVSGCDIPLAGLGYIASLDTKLRSYILYIGPISILYNYNILYDGDNIFSMIQSQTLTTCVSTCAVVPFFCTCSEKKKKALCRIHLNLRVLTWMRIIVQVRKKEDCRCRFLKLGKDFQFVQQL